MATPRSVGWVDRLAWVLIFGGLAALVLGLAARGFDAATAWTLIVAGGVAAAAGIALVWVRSRLREAPR